MCVFACMHVSVQTCLYVKLITNDVRPTHDTTLAFTPPAIHQESYVNQVVLCFHPATTFLCTPGGSTRFLKSSFRNVILL